jgi:hypothetical protein
MELSLYVDFGAVMFPIYVSVVSASEVFTHQPQTPNYTVSHSRRLFIMKKKSYVEIILAIYYTPFKVYDC